MEVDDVALGGPRRRGLLAVLLLHANESVSAERLMLALWGQDAPPTAIKALHVAVSRLRSSLGDADAIETTPSGYRVRLAPGELDLDRFAAGAAAGRESLAAGRPERAAQELREALALWRGPPLAGLETLPFAAAEIARLEEQRFEALEARVEADLAGGRHAELVAELRGLVAEHPWRERLHGQLMLALYRTGRQADALDAYAAARAALVEQLGIEPGPQLRDLQRAVLAHDPAIAPPGAVRAPALPTPPAQLFGRAADLDRVCEQIRRSRLVTVVGPGGVGKTSLAVAAARRLDAEFADGARFVALAAVTDPAELTGAIERALAVVSDDEPPGTALRRYLAERELLLILDNFEQLVAGAPLVGDLLAAAPGLAVLCTSREATRLAAERVYPLAPLDGSVAVELFVDRVRAREGEFALDPESASHVRAICDRLDGLPLAVELAAARIGLLSPAELAARLEHALPVLTGGVRDAPERQRTLRATIDWSFELLAAAEREAFVRFAVFAGGATVEAAEDVTGASLDTLHSLVAKQLLRRRVDRLAMLVLMREYALERLAADPDCEAVHRRLAARCIAAAEAERDVADSLEARSRLDAELPNAIEAMRTALATGADETAADLAIAWGRYWVACNRRDDGIAWVEAALERELDPDRRARLRLTRGMLHGARRREQHRADVGAALEHFRAAGDLAAVATCLGHLSFAAVWVGDYDRGQQLADEAVCYAEQAADDHVLAQALADRAVVGERYDDIAARARPAVAALRAAGVPSALSGVCALTGFVAVSERREAEGLPWIEEAVRAARSVGGDRLPVALGNLGLAKVLLGDLDAAEAALVEAVALTAWSAHQPFVDEALLALAAVYASRGEDDRAAVLVGLANANPPESRHFNEVQVWHRLNDELLAPARERLGAAAWEQAGRRGAAMSVREALDLVQPRATLAAPSTL